MKRNIKIISGLCAVIMLIVNMLTFSASASEESEFTCNNGDKAYAIYLYDLTEGEALYEKNADKLISPASTVKMMTALVALEAFPDVEREITVTEAMTDGMETHVLGLSVGETVTVKSLLIALVCGGYNDAAQALAVASSGSVAAFVEKMNAKAKELGATDTTYKEPTGIDDSAETTARDTMLVASSFMDSETLCEYSSLPSYKLLATNKSKVKTIFNRNALISAHTASKYLNSHAIGMNAGMTSGGGYCVVTGVNNGGRRYICIVMGAKHGADTNTTYSYAIANELIAQITRFDARPVLSAEDKIGELPIEGASLGKETVSVRPSKNMTAYLPNGYDSDGLLEYTYVYSVKEVVAPVREGDAVGKIIVSYNGEIVGVCDMVIAEDAEREPIIYALYVIREFLTGRKLILILACLCLSLFIKLAVVDRKKQKKNRYQKRYL